MSALFEEQNISALEHAADAIIPNAAYEEMTVHHERLLITALENAVSQIGGIPHSSSIEFEG